LLKLGQVFAVFHHVFGENGTPTALQAFPQCCSAIVVVRFGGDAALAFREKPSHSVMMAHQSV